MNKENSVPSLSEYRDSFKRPNYLGDPNTPDEMIREWFQNLEDKYYEIYGQEKIECLRYVKEDK